MKASLSSLYKYDKSTSVGGETVYKHRRYTRFEGNLWTNNLINSAVAKISDQPNFRMVGDVFRDNGKRYDANTIIAFYKDKTTNESYLKNDFAHGLVEDDLFHTWQVIRLSDCHIDYLEKVEFHNNVTELESN
jgi:hypothetical protein